MAENYRAGRSSAIGVSILLQSRPRAGDAPRVSEATERDDDDREEEDDDAPAAIARPRKAGFSTAQRGAARAFAEAFFSRDGLAVPAERLDWFAEDLSDFFGNVGGRGRVLFLACLATATWGAPILIGRPLTRLGSLTVAERLEALEALERTPVAQLALFALKAVSSIVYYEHPDARREMRWDQRCMGRTHLPVLAATSPSEASE